MPRHAWDRETISSKAREAPDEEQRRTQHRARVSLGLVLVLGTQTWFGAISSSPGPAQAHLMSCSWPSCSWGWKKGTLPSDSILGKCTRAQPGIPFSFEAGEHTDINNGENTTPLPWSIFHTFTAPPQPGKFSLFPPYPGLYRILRVGKTLRDQVWLFGSFSRGVKPAPGFSPLYFYCVFQQMLQSPEKLQHQQLLSPSATALKGSTPASCCSAGTRHWINTAGDTQDARGSAWHRVP